MRRRRGVPPHSGFIHLLCGHNGGLFIASPLQTLVGHQSHCFFRLRLIDLRLQLFRIQFQQGSPALDRLSVLKMDSSNHLGISGLTVIDGIASSVPTA